MRVLVWIIILIAIGGGVAVWKFAPGKTTQVGGELIIKPGHGHFNLEKGPEYKQFPLILETLGEI